MGRRKNETPRVRGPSWLPSRQRWRVIVERPDRADGGRNAKYFLSQEDAEKFALRARAQLARFGVTTIGQAVDGYAAHLTEKGTIGFAETIRRLRLFFPDPELRVSRLTPERCKGLYESFRKRLRPDKEPISVAYHRAALINARSFLTWAIEENGWLAENPLAKVKGIGKRNRGKKKHTGDETRKLYAFCLARAQTGDRAALGVLMALLMALRSSDVTRLDVRDVDLDATQLNVDEGKSERSNEPRLIPLVLQPMLRELAAGRPPLEPLFKTPYRKDGRHTRRWLEEAMARFCAQAEVPYVCPHALKSTAGTILAKRGALADAIAEHLSHEQSSTTMQHYVAPAVVEQAQAERAFAVISGGKK